MIEFHPIQTNTMPRKEKVFQRIWELARPILFGGTFWFARSFRVKVVRFLSWLADGDNHISKTASLSRSSRIDYPWRLTIGDDSSIGNSAWVYPLADIQIGNRVCVGEDVRLLTGTHSLTSPSFDLIVKPIVIHDNVWIATGAYVLPGVTIGEGAVVAAGAVVTKDVEPWTVVGGNPARVIKKRELVEDANGN